MNRVSAIVLLGALVCALTSCSRIVDKITGTENMKKAPDLWSDVPRMDGLGPSDTELPMYVKVLMRTALNNLYRLNNANEDRTPASGDWIVFTTTKSTADIKNFYTSDRMTSFGSWDANKNSPCAMATAPDSPTIGCVFKKIANNRGIGLLLVAKADEQKKNTNVFFVRVETEETPATNKPAASPTAKGQPSH